MCIRDRGETLGAAHHGHHERGERVRPRDGVVGSRFRKGQMFLHLAGPADLAQERDEAGQTVKGRDRLRSFVQNQLGSPKNEVISARVVLCRVGSGCLSINPYAHSPLLNATLFLFRSLGLIAVSYTHLDVYKRQEPGSFSH